MSILCKLGIHDWIFGYRYGWVVAKKCNRCDQTKLFHIDDIQDNTIVYKK